MIEVREPGLLTTIQDLGRPGLSHFGISIGGAADPVALANANALVGNGAGVAGLEMTLRGGAYRFTERTELALSGSDFAPRLDGVPIPMHTRVTADQSALLELGATREGARAYLAIAGGIEVPEVLGSRSTLVAAGLGGLGGRPLRRGDRLAVGRPARASRAPIAEWTYDSEPDLRVVAGTDFGLLDERMREILRTHAFVVTEACDRSGLRLDGPVLEGGDGESRLTEGVSWGTVQWPPGGSPLVILCEQATTGGYPKVAQVVTQDLYKLGQLKPRDRIRFRFVGFAEET